jgi:hypothetical protein|eukprot:5604042-Prymnesium_polylepis.2
MSKTASPGANGDAGVRRTGRDDDIEPPTREPLQSKHWRSPYQVPQEDLLEVFQRLRVKIAHIGDGFA